jgi:integrase
MSKKKRDYRSKGDGGLYQIRNNTLWRAVEDVGFWPDGRRKTIEATHKTQAGARDKLKKKLEEISLYGTTLDKTTTVAVWAKEWLANECRPNLTPNGFVSYESNTRNWIIPILGNKKVAELKPSDVRKILKAVEDKGLKASTGLKAYGVLSRMLEAARLEGLCTKNVAEDVATPTANVPTVGALTPEQTLAMLRRADEEYDGVRWWVALLAGLRQGERLGSRRISVDLETSNFRVDWALSEVRSEHHCGPIENGKWPCGYKRGASCPNAKLMVPRGYEYERIEGRLCLTRPKSKKPRTVPIPPPVLTRLRAYLIATKDDYNPHGLLFHDQGRPITAKADEQLWRDMLFAAGMITAEQAKQPKDREEGTEEPPPAHSARHTTATVLMELGVDAKIIGEIVGHQSTRTTQGYQHVTSAVATEAMGKLGTHYETALAAIES